MRHSFEAEHMHLAVRFVNQISNTDASYPILARHIGVPFTEMIAFCGDVKRVVDQTLNEDFGIGLLFSGDFARVAKLSPA